LPAAPDTLRNRPVADECARPRDGWIFCDDFESDRTRRYFEYADRDSSFRRMDGVGVLGSAAMRAHFAAGQTDAGSLKLAFGRTPMSYMRPLDSGATEYREIYWRLYVRTDSGWTGGGGDKLSRAQSLVSTRWAQAMGAPVWSGSGADRDYLVIDPYSGTSAGGALVATTYNDFATLRWLGAARSATPIFDAAHAGRWYCVEAHARLSDPGAANGVFELWIDDWLEARRDGLAWTGATAPRDFSRDSTRADSTRAGAARAYGINTVFLENYWNAGSPVAQSRYIDNFVVSTRRIGCGRITPP
jgi:hypothetical protein